MTADQKKAAGSALKAAIAAAEGRYLDAAGHAAEALLDLVPSDQAQQLLSDAAIRRANEAADAVEKERFG